MNPHSTRSHHFNGSMIFVPIIPALLLVLIFLSIQFSTAQPFLHFKAMFWGVILNSQTLKTFSFYSMLCVSSSRFHQDIFPVQNKESTMIIYDRAISTVQTKEAKILTVVATSCLTSQLHKVVVVGYSYKSSCPKENRTKLSMNLTAYLMLLSSIMYILTGNHVQSKNGVGAKPSQLSLLIKRFLLLFMLLWSIHQWCVAQNHFTFTANNKNNNIIKDEDEDNKGGVKTVKTTSTSPLMPWVKALNCIRHPL